MMSVAPDIGLERICEVATGEAVVRCQKLLRLPELKNFAGTKTEKQA